MKPIKTLGLAALAALLAMAFAGTPSAIAESTSLCESDESTCAAENAITHAHATTYPGEQATLLTSAFNVNCDVLLLGDALASLASPLTIHGVFTYSNCSNSCKVTEENGPSVIKLLREGFELADLTVKVLIHFVCSGFVNCRYNGESMEGHVVGPLSSFRSNGEGVLSKQTMNKESGSLCPSIAELDIVIADGSNPIYIAK